MQTIINVPGKFKADEYGTPLANVSDIYDDVANQKLSKTINNLRDEVNTKASEDYVNEKIDSGVYIQARIVNDDGTTMTDYGAGEIFFTIEEENKMYHIALRGGHEGDDVTETGALSNFLHTASSVEAVRYSLNILNPITIDEEINSKSISVINEQDLTTTQRRRAQANIGIDELMEDVATKEDVNNKADNSDLQTLAIQTNSRLGQQDDAIALLNGNDVIVVADHTQVASPDTQKIYREYGVSSYTDYMCTDATTTPPTWQAIATYAYPGVENVPTKDSDKFVKSKGIYESIAVQGYKTGYSVDGVADFTGVLTLEQFPISANQGEKVSVSLENIGTNADRPGIKAFYKDGTDEVLTYVDLEPNDSETYTFVASKAIGSIGITLNSARTKYNVSIVNPNGMSQKVASADNIPTSESDRLIQSGAVAKVCGQVHADHKEEYVASGGSYTYHEIHLYQGRKYRITNTTEYSVNFYDANDNEITTMALSPAAGTKPTEDVVITKDCVKLKMLGEGKVTIVALNNILNPDVFSSGVLHTENGIGNSLVKEFYMPESSGYTTVSLEISNTNNWVRVVCDGTPVTSYISLSSLESFKVMDLDAAYAVFDLDFFNLFPGNISSINIVNYDDLELNPLISQYLLTHGDNKGVTELAGVNILKSTEDGKGVLSDGQISSNEQWIGRFAVTERLYFNGHDSITCSGCAPKRGFYYAVYDETNHRVSGGAQESTIITAEKGENGVYARFTVETFNTPTQISGDVIQAQYGDTITEYEPYSPIGGYIPQKVFFCGPNREIKTFKEGVEKATSVMDGVLYVDPGVYNLITEFGSDYFESISAVTELPGLALKNRVHIICSSNTKITCHYEGSNVNVLRLFSPLNAGEYGFTIENMNIEASRTRYLIHDERNGGSEQCQHKYLNCSFKFDNSNNPSWTNEAIIGGGLGCASEVDIQNCIFECKRNTGYAISYHQNNKYETKPVFRSTINIDGNYIIRGRIVFTFDHESTGDDVTTVQIKNNSVPYVEGQQDGGLWSKGGNAWTKNVAYVWNNEVRHDN